MPLETPMVQETKQRVEEIINDLHQGNHVDAMTKKWLSRAPSPSSVPVFTYSLTKIHKPVLTGRPIISGFDGPTERISSFLDHILQPVDKAQKSYLKGTTCTVHQLYRKEVKRKVSNNAIQDYMKPSIRKTCPFLQIDSEVCLD